MLRNSAPRRPSRLPRTEIADRREAKPRRKVDSMSIQIDGNTTVRELVGRYPQTRKTFEKYGIDYCCGGGRCLAEVAQERRAALPDLVRDIEAALVATSPRTATAEKDWYAAPLHELIDHIFQVHHAYMHEALPRIKELVRKVLNAHGAHQGICSARC